MTGELKVHTEFLGEMVKEKVIVINVEGYVCGREEREEFFSKIDRVAERKKGYDIAIDLSKCTGFGRYGIGTLIGLTKSLEGRKQRLIIQNPSKEVIKILKQTALDEFQWFIINGKLKQGPL